MFKKFKNIFFFILFFSFILSIAKYYFSEKNIIITNKSRSSYTVNLNAENSDIPLLKNDTSDIIIYKNDLEEFKKKRKKRFWEKLISGQNE
tara:strand:+ start:2826 stop:3098 length:273 start_codon:yes stop_codon:yes gene_type:complete